MAVYTTNADVQASLQNTTLSTTTKPTLLQVDDFIIQISADMDARMRNCGINLPVVGGLDFLRRICIFGVVAHVYRDIDESETRWTEFQRLYDQGKDEICGMGNAIFAGSTTPIVAPVYTWEDRTDSDGNSTAPFQRNKVQW